MDLTIGELNIRCADVEKSLHFYKDTLGFVEVEREGDCVRLDLRGKTVLLMPKQENDKRGVSFDLSTSNADLIKEKVQRAGYPTEDRTYGDWKFFAVTDPDGNEFEIIEMQH